MSQRNEKRAVRRYAYKHIEKYQRLIAEIKGFDFSARWSIAWAILRGNKRRKF